MIKRSIKVAENKIIKNINTLFHLEYFFVFLLSNQSIRMKIGIVKNKTLNSILKTPL